MRTKTYYLPILLILLFSLFVPAQDESKTTDPAASITLAELKDHMYFLASDFLGGRVVGTPGYEIAMQYAAAQLKAAGIEPFMKDEKGNPTYFQKFDIVKQYFSGNPWWSIRNPEGTRKSELGAEMIAFNVQGKRIAEREKEIYFVGYGISEPDHGWDDLKDLDLKDKVALIWIETPQKDGKPILPEEIDKSYQGLNGFNKRIQTLYARGIKSFIFLSNEELNSMWDRLGSYTSKYDYVLPEELEGEELDLLIAYANEQLSQFILAGQEYSPYQNSDDPREGYKTFQLKNAGILLNSTWEKEIISTWNVVGMIPGKDETLKEEYIVLGGHLDHIPPQDGQICNGADDNASGSIGVMEVAEALVMKEHKRPILVCLWAAEEVGLYGSRYFVSNCPVKLEQIKVNINLDMIGRTDKDNAESRAIYLLSANNATPEFSELIKKTNADSVNWPIVFQDEEAGAGASDHSSFGKEGIPAIFFFSGLHKDYHKPTDDAENIDWEKFLNVSRLAFELVDTLADLDISLATFNKFIKTEAEVVH